RDANSTEAAAVQATQDSEDKPPSYDAILTLDGLPPDYFSVLSEKPPRYEDVAEGVITLGSMSLVAPVVSQTESTGDPPNPGEETPPCVSGTKNLSSPAGDGVEAHSISQSRSKKEEIVTVVNESLSQSSEASETPHPSSVEQETGLQTRSVPKLTIGYDNEAYTPHDELSPAPDADSSVNHLRESES
ncbi:hypothetical protein SK128_026785, partial [Halocaridina rubra]